MAPMLLVMGAIFLLSHQPDDSFDLPSFPGADKLAHLIIYGTLAAAIIFAFAPETRQKKRWPLVGMVILIATLYGVSDEIHQSFIPGRSPDIIDVLADLAGAAVITLFWKFR